MDARLTGSVSAGNYDNSGYDDDWTEIMKRRENGDWDLLMWAQNTLPAGDPAWFLNTFFHSDGGNNFAGLDDATVDSEIEDLELLSDHAARVTATAEAQTAIQGQFAVSNLVTPAWHVGLSTRMADYEPYGSDYYIINDQLFVTDPQTVEEGATVASAAAATVPKLLAAAVVAAAVLLRA